MQAGGRTGKFDIFIFNFFKGGGRNVDCSLCKVQLRPLFTSLVGLYELIKL